MDPIVGGAIISTLGGLFGASRSQKAGQAAARQERKWALEDTAEQFTRLRAAAEKGGFNPLAVLGVPGAGMPRATAANSADYMGKAIAESSLMLADSYAKTQAARQGRTVEDLRRQRDILVRKLTDATIRPTVAGIYGNGGGNAGIPDVSPAGASVSGPSGGNGDSRLAGNVGLPPLLTQDPIDPRRKVDDKPVSTTSGFMIVDNPYFGRLYSPTLTGDEPLGGEIMGPVYVAPQLAFKGGVSLTFGGGPESKPAVTRAEGLRIREERLEKARDAMEWRKPRLWFNPNHRDGYYYP